MSTQGTVGVRYKGQDYLTYNHYDSYPSGLGQEVVDFVRKLNPRKVGRIKHRITRLEIVNEVDEPTKEERARYGDAFFENVSNGRDWYSLLRGLQGITFIEELAKKDTIVKHAILNNDFIKESLHCEWGYIINLDSNELEVYRGFQKSPHNNRYTVTPYEGYYQCKMIMAFPLEYIPDNWIDLLKEAAESPEPTAKETEMAYKVTKRGFSCISFEDGHGVECSAQESSHGDGPVIWLGCNKADPKHLVFGEGWKPVKMPKEYTANTRMYLTQELAADLIPILEYFRDTGELPEDL